MSDESFISTEQVKNTHFKPPEILQIPFATL